MTAGWNQLPRALRVALGAWTAVAVVDLAMVFTTLQPANLPRVLVVATGASYGAMLLYLVAAFQLARRIPDARVAMRLVVAATLARCVLHLVYPLVFPVLRAQEASIELIDTILPALGQVAAAATLLAIVGWAIAARSVAAGVVGGLAVLAAFEGARVVVWLGGEDVGAAAMVVPLLGQLVHLGVLAAAAARAGTRASAASAPAPARALREMRSAMWILAGGIAVAVLSIAVVRHAGDHAVVVAALAVITIGAIAAVRLGLGVAALADEPGAGGWVAGVAAVVAFTAVALAFSLMFQVFDEVVDTGRSSSAVLGILAFGAPATAALATVAAVAAVAAIARDRGAARVGSGLVAATIACGVLFACAAMTATGELGSVTIPAVVLAVLAVVVATVIAAVAFDHAAAQIGGAGQLPTATVRAGRG